MIFNFAKREKNVLRLKALEEKCRSQRASPEGCGMILGQNRLPVCPTNRPVRGRVTAGQWKPTTRGCTFVVRFLRLQ